MILSSVSAMFHGPLFVGVEYQLEVQNKGRAQSKAIIRDAGRIIAAITFKFESGEPGRAPSEEACPRLVPLDHRPEDLREGLEIKGDYAPKSAALADLLLRWGLSAKGIAPAQAAALLWASFVVGMELPGERAVFSHLRISFSPNPAAEGPIAYLGRVTAFNPQYNVVEIEGKLSRGGTTLADVELSSLVRDDPTDHGYASAPATPAGFPRTGGQDGARHWGLSGTGGGDRRGTRFPGVPRPGQFPERPGRCRDPS